MGNIYLPIKGNTICGHKDNHDLIGSEKGTMVVAGGKANYAREYIYTSCTECEKEARNEMENEIKRMELQ